MRWNSAKLDALLRRMERHNAPLKSASTDWLEELRACRVQVKPVKAKRAKPRKGAVKDPEFLSWMATQPCLVTGKLPATTHHVRSFGSPKNDNRTIRLIAELHMLTHEKPGKPCIERLGKREFERRYNINIEAAIKSYNLLYIAE